MRRVAFASCAGTTIEFYDFFIYGTAAALVFPTVFFPSLGAAAGTVASFATFAVCFRAPAPSESRHRSSSWPCASCRALRWVVSGPARPCWLPSTPTEQTWSVCRLPTAWSGHRLRALQRSFLVINKAVGDTSPAFLEWGWRVPFLASALLVLIGLYVRLKVEETPMFKVASNAPTKGSTQAPIPAAFKNQWREILLGGGALAMLFAFFYIGTACLTTYGTKTLGLSRATVLTMGVVGAVVFGIVTALSAIYSDRVGRRKVVLVSCLIAIPWALVLFPIMNLGGPWAFALGLFGTMSIFAISYGPAGAMLPEMFKTEYRFTGAGMAYNLAGVLGGGTAPYLASSFLESGNTAAIGWLLAGFGALSVVCIVLMQETKHRAMAEHPDPTVDATGAAEPSLA